MNGVTMYEVNEQEKVAMCSGDVVYEYGNVCSYIGDLSSQLSLDNVISQQQQLAS